MSRYLLIPTNVFQLDKQQSSLNGFESYSLTPAEGFNEQSKNIKIPTGLNPYNDVYTRVKNKNKFKRLLLKIAKTDIGRNKDGFVTDGHNVLRGISFDNAVLDSCNGRFSDYYESFYCLLRRFGITF